jgi:hypothetical protein
LEKDFEEIWPKVFFIFHYFPIEPFEKLQKAANSSILEIDYKVSKLRKRPSICPYRKFGPAHRNSCRPHVTMRYMSCGWRNNNSPDRLSGEERLLADLRKIPLP